MVILMKNKRLICDSIQKNKAEIRIIVFYLKVILRFFVKNDRKVTIYFGSPLLNRYLFLAFDSSFVTL